MKILAAILILAATTAIAQNTVIFDSRISPWSNNNVRSIDLAIKSRALNPDLYEWNLKGYIIPTVVPALVNPRLSIYAAITGNMNQARADLQRADEIKRPAYYTLQAALTNGTKKAKRKELRDAAENAQNDNKYRKAMRAIDKFNELVQDAEDERNDLGIKRDEQ